MQLGAVLARKGHGGQHVVLAGLHEMREMRLLLDGAPLCAFASSTMANVGDPRLAEIGPGMCGRMSQRHEHPAAAPFALMHAVPHDRLAAAEAMRIHCPAVDAQHR